MPTEPIFFHKGLTFDRVSSLQEPGYLKTAKNVIFERDGITENRPGQGKVNTTAVGSIHSMKAWRNNILVNDTTHLRGNAGTGDFTDLYASFTNAIWQYKAYKEFLLGSNGTNFILLDDDRNAYPAQVPNPSTSPSGAEGDAGNPNGSYKLYVTFFITWPNGQTYETGLSPVGSDVSASNKKIAWTSIPVSTYAEYYGTAPTIYRNLYRGPGSAGTLTEIYYVATISDNTTATYTDDVSDVTLQTGLICTSNDYLPMIVPKYFEVNYGRIFGIHPTYTNRMYWSEVGIGDTAIANELLMPFSYLADNWDDLRVSGFDAVDPQGLVSYGSYLFIPLKHTWIRKQGNDPDTWAYRKTYATYGIGAPWTLDRMPQGIIGLSNPENEAPILTIFNGQTSEAIVSPKLNYILKTDLNIDYIQYCRGVKVGQYYHLLYPSNSATTTPDKHLALDMTRGMGDVRIANWADINAMCLSTDTQSKKVYFGGSDGYTYEKDDTEGVNIEIETHDLIGGNPQLNHTQKAYKELKYALKGTATMYLYIDDVLQTWPDATTSKAITGTSELSQVLNSLPQNWKGKRLRIKIVASDVTEFELYSPWAIEFTS